ncbi:MAG: DNA adenine methylase [bacterium]
MKKQDQLSAFSWYGGKTCHLNWLLPIIDSVEHTAFVEPFAGSGAIILNKNPSPVEVYNDLYGDVVNFFQVLRNQGEDLIKLLELTPYSREEFSLCCDNDMEISSIEKARRFFVKARQVRNGLATMATPGRWSYTKKDSRRDRALTVSQWLSAIDGLDLICKRLRNVQIENLDAFELIPRYDTENTLFYVDPPYLMSSRTGGINYKHEFSDQDHINLINLLLSLKGKVIISGYQSDLYSKMLSSWNETKNSFKLANSTLKDGEKKERQEIIWTNFEVGVK